MSTFGKKKATKVTMTPTLFRFRFDWFLTSPEPGDGRKRIANFDGRTGGLTNWRTDGLTMFKYLSTLNQIAYFLRPFKEINPLAQRRRVGLRFWYHFWNPGGNSVLNGNVQLFCYINWIVYYLRPFEEKIAVAQRRRVGMNFW